MPSVNGSEHITIGCWNIQGLVNNTHDKSVDETFLNAISDIDVVALVETHLVEGQGNIPVIADFDTKYFNRPKHHRAAHGSGGIGILSKPHVTQGLKFIPSKDNNQVWVKFEISIGTNIYLYA